MAAHVVLAIDDEHLRLLMGRVLKKAAYRISAVEDGPEALTCLLEARKRGERVDLLVCDRSTRSMTARELMQDLRAMELSLPVLLVGEAGEEAILARLPASPPAAFLRLPFAEGAASEAVEVLLERSRREAEE
jgi:CheY-like chemotaxis protein